MSQFKFETDKTTSVAKHWGTQSIFAWTLFIWGTVSFFLAKNGVYTGLPNWGFPLIIFCGISIPVIFYLKNMRFKSFMDSIPLKHLTIFHVWRIPAGLYFLSLGAQGLLPTTFVNNAAYGDILVGCLVPVLFTFRESNKNYLWFHLFSLADFILAVGTGLTFTVLKVPLMANIQQFPVALIPAFGVCITGFLSIIALVRLLKG